MGWSRFWRSAASAARSAGKLCLETLGTLQLLEPLVILICGPATDVTIFAALAAFLFKCTGVVDRSAPLFDWLGEKTTFWYTDWFSSWCKDIFQYVTKGFAKCSSWCRDIFRYVTKGFAKCSSWCRDIFRYVTKGFAKCSSWCRDIWRSANSFFHKQDPSELYLVRLTHRIEDSQARRTANIEDLTETVRHLESEIKAVRLEQAGRSRSIVAWWNRAWWVPKVRTNTRSVHPMG